MFAKLSEKTQAPRSARSQTTGRAQARLGTPSTEHASENVRNADAASLQGRWEHLVHRGPGPSSAQAPTASDAAVRRPCPLYIQAQLKVGHPDDPLEHEAETVAAQVMHGPAPSISAPSGATAINRKCTACEEEEGKLQRKSAGLGGPAEAPAIVHDVLRSPGRPLDAATRSAFEMRFGRDFSDVRIHSDSMAAQSARLLNANAYTVGSNIAFDAGMFAPATDAGRRLLAHELTHVVQQKGAAPLSFGKAAPFAGRLASPGSRVSAATPRVQRDKTTVMQLHPEESGTFSGSFQLPTKGDAFFYSVELHNVSPLLLDRDGRYKLQFEVESGIRTVLQEALKTKQPLAGLPTMRLSLDAGFSRAFEEGHVRRIVTTAARRELTRTVHSEETKASVVLNAIVNIMSFAYYVGDPTPGDDRHPDYYIKEKKTVTEADDIALLWAWFNIYNGRFEGSIARARINRAASETAILATRVSAMGKEQAKLVAKYSGQVDTVTRIAARQEVQSQLENRLAVEVDRPGQAESNEGKQEEAIRSMAARTVSVLAELAHVTHRLSEAGTTVEKAEHMEEMAHHIQSQYDKELTEYIHKVFTEHEFPDEPHLREVKQASGGRFADGLAFFKGGLDAISTIMTLKDPKSREELFNAHSQYFSQNAANYAESTVVILKFISGAATFGGATAYGIARIAGNAAIAEQVLGMTVKSIGNIAGPLFLVDAIHGVAVLFDPDASPDEKVEAGVEIASSVVGFAGFMSRWAKWLSPASEWSGPIAASLWINYWMLKGFAHLYHNAVVGLSRLDWVDCYQASEAEIAEVRTWMRNLAITDALLIGETDPYRKAQLQQNASTFRMILIEEQLKPFIEAREKSTTRWVDPASCGPALNKRLKPMVAILAGVNSDEAALGAGAAFLTIMETAFDQWDDIVLNKPERKAKPE